MEVWLLNFNFKQEKKKEAEVYTLFLENEIRIFNKLE